MTRSLMIFPPAPPAQQKRKKFQNHIVVVHVYVLWEMSEVLVELKVDLRTSRWGVGPSCDVPASTVEGLVVDGVG
eukprot:16434000-Heterocapsa_arctica.AAC.1